METRKTLRERVGREQQLVDRLRTAGLSIRTIASATDLSPSRVHQVLNGAEATDMPEWLSPPREADRCLGGKDDAEPAGSNAEICSRLVSEVKVLRRCISIGWNGRKVVKASLSIRGSTRTRITDYVAFDPAPVMRILVGTSFETLDCF